MLSRAKNRKVLFTSVMFALSFSAGSLVHAQDSVAQATEVRATQANNSETPSNDPKNAKAANPETKNSDTKSSAKPATKEKIASNTKKSTPPKNTSENSLSDKAVSSEKAKADADNDSSKSSEDTAEATETPKPVPKAENIDLEEVITELKPSEEKPPQEEPKKEEEAASKETDKEEPKDSSANPKSDSTDTSTTDEAAEETQAPTEEEPAAPDNSKIILGVEVPPNTKTRLVWSPEEKLSGLAERTPVLVVNGAHAGQTLCLTAAVHGDELNGIEMIRRVMYNLDPGELTGTVVGVPVVNLMGFRRNSRYLPDRRDLNRYFPGNTSGSSASRIAYSLFHEIILQCDALVDLHTGSFHRTNLTQLRADLSVQSVSDLAHQFGAIAVMNSRGNYGSLRAAAVRAGVPTVTIEAGEPMRLQNDVVAEGVKAVRTLITNLGMYGSASRWFKSAPVYYKSYWIRADQSGILFSKINLGERVSPGEVLGTVTDPITNARSEIISPYHGRILGMALDQVVMPGFAAYHIGIQTPEERLKEESGQPGEDGLHVDDDGDDAVTPPVPVNQSGAPQEVPKDRDELDD